MLGPLSLAKLTPKNPSQTYAKVYLMDTLCVSYSKPVDSNNHYKY